MLPKGITQVASQLGGTHMVLPRLLRNLAAEPKRVLSKPPIQAKKSPCGLFYT
jgi:hypothetical protein